MTKNHLIAFLLAASLTRRLYNAYLEAVYFAFPQRRLQPTSEHALKSSARDLCARDKQQLDALVWHDRLTLLSQFALVVGCYYGLPGFYPRADSPLADAPLHVRFARLLAHHYLLSFGMYWAHRSLHTVPLLWRRIHSIHHWAKHPLSRVTYQDHWLDNLGNALVGEVAAQILIPLDAPTFVFSRLFRILESLEKHAGVSGATNLAHSVQQWLPFAQMPHHHDWHHEGHKACNFTFSSIGGLWDCLFGTRKAGRANGTAASGATRRDRTPESKPSRLVALVDREPALTLSPVVAVLVAAALRLHATGGNVVL